MQLTGPAVPNPRTSWRGTGILTVDGTATKFISVLGSALASKVCENYFFFQRLEPMVGGCFKIPGIAEILAAAPGILI